MKKLLYILTGVSALILVVAIIVSAFLWPTINEVETGITPEYPEIQPQYYSTEPERIFEEARAAVEAMPNWEVVQSDPRAHRLEAERTTRVFRFVDDVTIEVEPVTEFVAQVHLRSASRVGKGDFGQNARNIEEFFVELDGRLGAVRFRPEEGEDVDGSDEGEPADEGDEQEVE